MTNLLDGKQLPFRTAPDRKRLVWRAIKYLREGDVDKSGRGYFFPRVGVVEYVSGRNIFLEGGNVIYSLDLREVVDE